MQHNEQNQSSSRRMRRMRDFFYHLVVFVFCVAVLVIVTNSGVFVWIGLFWGFAVALHGVYAYFG